MMKMSVNCRLMTRTNVWYDRLVESEKQEKRTASDWGGFFVGWGEQGNEESGWNGE